MDRIFGLDQQTLISIAIQLFNACLLAAVLTFILYKPVRKFLQKRSDAIEAQIANAEKDTAKANELKAFYEKRIQTLEAEQNAVLEAAQEKAAEKGKLLLAETEKAIGAAKKQAAEEMRHERERAGEEMRIQIIEIAALMAEKFVALSMDANTQNRLFEETMQELEDAL